MYSYSAPFYSETPKAQYNPVQPSATGKRVQPDLKSGKCCKRNGPLFKMGRTRERGAAKRPESCRALQFRFKICLLARKSNLAVIQEWQEDQ